MRIGFDMLGVQAPHHGHRGIGGYSQRLVTAMLARDDGHEYVLYAHTALPADRIPSAPNAQLRWLGGDTRTGAQCIDRLGRANPDGLDVLVVLSPFEHGSSYHPPSRWDGGPRLVAVVHDLIPFLFPREGAYDRLLMRQYRVLEELKRYDALLAVSEATRRDCLRLLGVAEDRVTTIGGASDEQFFTPDRAVVQAGQFSWSATAARTGTVLESLPSRRPVAPLCRDAVRRRGVRPRIAFFSPFPPKKSGIADYSAALIGALQSTYTIDLYHEPGYVPEPALAEGGFACCDARLFRRQEAVRDYQAIVYQMGNSRYHNFMYETMLRHPGVVTLHDFCLAGFHLDRDYRQGRGLEPFRAALIEAYPGQAEAIARVLRVSSWDWEALTRECAARGWDLNGRVIKSAMWTVVHSPWCLERLRAESSAEAKRVATIPLGARPREALTAAQRGAIRDRFGLPRAALIVASFGSHTPEKMGPEALDAFRWVAQADPSALFVFAGAEADGGTTRRHAAALGLADCVHFLGRLPAADYTDLVAAVDVGLSLRRPPTYGETSAALLDLLAAGVATIVTEVATFADFPDPVVRKVRWDAQGPESLAQALRTLASDRAARDELGRAARDHVRTHHDWSRVAEGYEDLIERCRVVKGRLDSASRCRPAGSWRDARPVARDALAIDGAG